MVRISPITNERPQKHFSLKNEMTLNVAHCMNSVLLQKGNTIPSAPRLITIRFHHVSAVVVLLLLPRLTLNTPGSTRVGDPGGGVGLCRASDARAGAVNERERKALGASCALAKLETTIDALSETALDACLFSTLARRVYVESAELGIQLLCVYAVLESEITVTCYGCSRRLLGLCGCGCG